MSALLISCGESKREVIPPLEIPPETTLITNLESTSIPIPPVGIIESVKIDGLKVAERVNPPTTIPYNVIDYVNSLSYGWGSVEPVQEAYIHVARSLGWSEASIARWLPFTLDVVMKESAGCWNARRGDILKTGTCGDYEVRGSGEDSGFGQLTSSIWGNKAILCAKYSICSGTFVRSTPYMSMYSMLLTFMELGRYPWCDYEGVPDLHNCTLVGYYERPEIL